MNRACHSTVAILGAVSLLAASQLCVAQQTDTGESSAPVTRQAQAVSRSVYEVIEKAREHEAAEQFATAIDLLTPLVDRGNLTDYEAANVYQLVGFYAHNLEDTTTAIEWFGRILSLGALEEPTRLSTLYTLAQLLAIEERFTEALVHIEKWFVLATNPPPDAYILKAQILYQLQRFRETVEPLETAIRIAESRGVSPKENWYSLLSFAYYQQENFAKIRDISKILVVQWPNKQYWMYLANAYRELGEDKNMLASYDAAHAQGLLDSESEIVMLAQLYLQFEVPLKAAELLEDSLQQGRIEPSAKNLRLLSQAWTLAREDERSIEPLQTAARLEGDGNLSARLANVFLNLGRNRDCVEAAAMSIKQGKLKNPDYAYITLGMCLYKLHEYSASIDAFREAAKAPRSSATAQQWIRVANLDLERLRRIGEVEEWAIGLRRELIAKHGSADSS